MKKVWLLENEQARWFEFEEPHDMPNDVTVTMLTETEQPAQQEPVSIKSIPTMDDAIAAGDSVLMNEQAAMLRECRAALDSLIAQKPMLAGLLCGSTTLGNLRAELGAYRPQGVFERTWVGLTDREVELIDGMIEVQMNHAEQCDRIANRTMAEKQKGWDMERVELLRKLKEKNT